MPRKGDKYILSISIDYSLYLRLKERARECGKSLSEVVEDALKNYLSTSADGNSKLTIEPFVVQPHPSIREVESRPAMESPQRRSVVEQLRMLSDEELGRLASQADTATLRLLARRELERRGVDAR